MTNRKLSSKSEWLLVLAIFAVIHLLSQIYQPPIQMNGGKGVDGISYYSLTENLCKGERPHNENGYFLRRLGTPYLASLVSCSDIIGAFRKINFATNLLITILLLLWFRRIIAAPWIRILMMFIFLSQWHAPIRWTHYYPVQTDSTSFIFILSGLIGLDIVRKNLHSKTGLALIYISSFVGAFFRENIILIPLAYPFVANILSDREHWQGRAVSFRSLFYWIPLALTISVFVYQSWLVTGNHHQLTETAIRLLLRRPITLYLFAWNLAYGPILILPFLFWKQTKEFFGSRQALLVYFTFGTALSYACGYDIERYVYWLMPIVYGLIGVLLEKNGGQILSRRFFSVLLIASQMISQRLFWTIPQEPNSFPHRFPILTPWGDRFPYYDLFATYAPLSVSMLSYAQYALLFILLILFYHQEKNQPA